MTAVLRSILQEAFAVSGSCANVVKRVLANGGYFEGKYRKFVCIFCFVSFLIGFTELYKHTVYTVKNLFRASLTLFIAN